METKTYHLSDVLLKVIDYRGKTPKKLGMEWNDFDGIIAISAKNVKHGSLINLDKSHLGSEELYNVWMKDGDLEPGDLILTSEAPLGEWYQVQVNDRFILSQRVFALRPNPEVLDADYFAALVGSDAFQHNLQNFATGTTVTGIRQKTLLTLEVSLPSVKTQRLIGQFIRNVHDKSVLNHQIIQNLTSMASRLFEHDFPAVHQGESILGDVMENFDRKRIPLSRREREQRQGKYRYVGATSVLDHVEGYIFDGIYLLMGEDGTVKTAEGMPILQYIWGRFWPNNHTHVLRGTKVSTEWLYLFLLNTNVNSRVTGAVQLKISQKNMNSIPLTVPSVQHLTKFQKVIAPMFDQIRLLAEESQRLSELRDLLLPKLISGDIDLTHLEEAMPNA